MSEIPSLKEMLEAGVHFGHETRRWNPKMSTYIFGVREKIHVIDLEKTEKALQEAANFVTKLGEEGKNIVFLATKKQASEIVKNEAQRVGAMFMSNRWLGGLFTNFDEVRKTIKKMDDLEEKSKDDAFTKREQLLMTRNLEKLDHFVGGVRKMETLPGAIFIVDAKKENNAVLEARKMKVPVVAIVDTNADPTKVDYPIPANDDAIRSIALMVKTIADAYEEGKQVHTKQVKKEEDKVAKAEGKTTEVKEEVKKEVSEEVSKGVKTKVKEKEEKPKKVVKKPVKAKKEAN